MVCYLKQFNIQNGQNIIKNRFDKLIKTSCYQNEISAQKSGVKLPDDLITPLKTCIKDAMKYL